MTSGRSVDSTPIVLAVGALLAIGLPGCGTAATSEEGAGASVDGEMTNGRSDAPTIDPAGSPVAGNGLPQGEAAFSERCASCHLEPDNLDAPSVEALAELSPAHVVFTVLNGSMRPHAQGLSVPDIMFLAEYVGSTREPYRPAADHYCEDRTPDVTPVVARWGMDARNTASVPDGVSRIDSGNVGELRLAWAFGLPFVADSRSQPVVTEGSLFVAATSGHLFALDRRTGCIQWHRELEAPPRSALTLGTVGERPALFFGDAQAHVSAVEAASGEPLWRVEARLSEHSMITGAPVQHEDRLIVPVSLYEVGLAADPSHECCRSHGGVVALEADTGSRLWTTHLAEPAEPQGETSVGTRRWGPSGVPVWSTPTVDPPRGLVYVGTGQNASRPATEYSDAVIALDLETGAVQWHLQTIAGDAYNDACGSFPPGPNCPSPAGPDHDIGGSIVLTRDGEGRDLLVFGQKSGDVFALDPDEAGRIVWRTRVGAGSALGGVHWGVAVANGVVFAPVADPPFPIPGYQPRPGLYALSVEDGDVLWEHPVTRGCETDLDRYFARSEFRTDCSLYFGLSALPLAANDLVFTASLDGRVRAHAAADGAVLWETETSRPFETINGVEAHGGAIDVAGVQVVGHMLYVQSGHSLAGQLPGNVLLAFELAER